MKAARTTIAAAGGTINAVAPELVVGVLALAVFGWSVRAVDPWSDELVTLQVASWPVSAIVKLAGHVDLVHAVYYALVHPFVMADHNILTVRVVSIVAMAVAAVALVRIGRALDGWLVGVGAGLMLIVGVTASRYAPGGVAYLPHWVRVMKVEFPLPDGIDDVTLERDGPSTAEIDGLQATPERAVERLERHCRIWAVTESGSLAGEGGESPIPSPPGIRVGFVGSRFS